MTAYYNEHDPYAAQWLRNLIKAGHIAPGIVDERDIRDIRPNELSGYTQCHFFAGIGVWSYALRNAGWPDDKPVWTGSCPCQPFSAAGRGAGVADERHLWPHWYHLISQCRPVQIFGEQVEKAIKHGWLDLVQADLEGGGYAVAPVGIPAAGVGSPNIRPRLWFTAERLADSASKGQQAPAIKELSGTGCREERREPEQPSYDGGVANTDRQRCNSGAEASEQKKRVGTRTDSRNKSFGVANTPSDRREREGEAGAAEKGRQQRPIESGQLSVGSEGHNAHDGNEQPGPTNGFWRAADWLFCRDGKWRPVEPGTFPLAHGAAVKTMGRMRPRLEGMGYSATEIKRILRRPRSLVAMAGKYRSGSLKGYGNAINAEAAQAFIEATMSHNK